MTYFMENPSVLIALIVLGGIVFTGFNVSLNSRLASTAETKREAKQIEANAAAAAIVANIRAKERQEDWDRLQAVAVKVDAAAGTAETAAQLLLDAQAKTISDADEVARKVAEADAKVFDQLDKLGGKVAEVKGMVDGNLTIQIEATMDEMIGRLAVMLELVEVKRLQKVEPTPAVLTAIGATEDRIEKYRALLARREAQLAQTEAATARAKTDAANERRAHIARLTRTPAAGS